MTPVQCTSKVDGGAGEGGTGVPPTDSDAPASTPGNARVGAGAGAGAGATIPFVLAVLETPRAASTHGSRHIKLSSASASASKVPAAAGAAATAPSASKKKRVLDSSAGSGSSAAESPGVTGVLNNARTPPSTAGRLAAPTPAVTSTTSSVSPVSSVKSALSVASSTPLSSCPSSSHHRRGHGAMQSMSTAKTVRGTCRRDSGDPVVFSLPSHQPPRPTPGMTADPPPYYSSQPTRQDTDAGFFSPLHENEPESTTSGAESPTSFQPLTRPSPARAAGGRAAGTEGGERARAAGAMAAEQANDETVGPSQQSFRQQLLSRASSSPRLLQSESTPELTPPPPRSVHPLLGAFIGEYYMNL